MQENVEDILDYHNHEATQLQTPLGRFFFVAEMLFYSIFACFVMTRLFRSFLPEMHSPISLDMVLYPFLATGFLVGIKVLFTPRLLRLYLLPSNVRNAFILGWLGQALMIAMPCLSLGLYLLFHNSAHDDFIMGTIGIPSMIGGGIVAFTSAVYLLTRKIPSQQLRRSVNYLAIRIILLPLAYAGMYAFITIMERHYQ